jgi:hypothetical protein
MREYTEEMTEQGEVRKPLPMPKEQSEEDISVSVRTCIHAYIDLHTTTSS